MGSSQAWVGQSSALKPDPFDRAVGEQICLHLCKLHAGFIGDGFGLPPMAHDKKRLCVHALNAFSETNFEQLEPVGMIVPQYLKLWRRRALEKSRNLSARTNQKEHCSPS